MAIEVKVPVLPESVTDAQMLEWHKKAGDAVSRDENLVDIETDKVVLEVPCPDDGVLTSIAKQTGETVHAQEVIAIIEPGAPASVATPAPALASATPIASPSSSGAGLEEIKVPVLPESVTDATMLEWLVGPGDSVHRGQNLVEIETDKVVLEVPAPVDGIIDSITRSAGDTVHANDIIAVLRPGASTGEASGVNASAGNVAGAGDAGQVEYGPAVRLMLEENEIDPSLVTATGPGGRILKEDVLRYFEQQADPGAAPSSAPSPQPSKQNLPAPNIAGSASAPASTASTSPTDPRNVRREPMSRLRRTIARRLVQSQQEAALLTTFNEVDLKEVMALRSRYKESFEKRHGVRLGFMSFFAMACVEALQRFPAINAYIEDDEIVFHDYCDIGVAVSSPRGLVVPVLRNVESMSFADVERTIGEFGAKAKEGKLTMDDLTGGTFTISNGGVFGSMLSTPIINPPQSGILGMHTIQQRPVVIDGEIVARPMMYLALSYDHRIVDGREAVQFLVAIKDALEDPARMMLGI